MHADQWTKEVITAVDNQEVAGSVLVPDHMSIGAFRLFAASCS